MAENGNNIAVDVELQQIAAVYAKAFLGAAEEAGKTDSLAAEFDALFDEVLDRYPEFERLLGSPFIAHQEKEGILDRTLGAQASDDLLTFLKVVSMHGRLDCLRAIRQVFGKLYRQLRGRIDVTLITPGKIDESLRDDIIKTLRGMLGAEPELTIVADSKLLGGAVVRVHDKVYDGSVASRLQRLRKQMITRTVEQIESSREEVA